MCVDAYKYSVLSIVCVFTVGVAAYIVVKRLMRLNSSPPPFTAAASADLSILSTLLLLIFSVAEFDYYDVVDDNGGTN